MNNKRTFLKIFFLLCVGFSQNKDMENNSGITGIVIQSDSKKPIQFAAAALVRTQDEEIESGKLTDENGFFSLKAVPAGKYHIEVDFIGFLPFIGKPFQYDPSVKPDIDMGQIPLQLKALEADLIEVNAERSLYVATVDKKVYVIDQLKTTSGGTCCDVMKKVPSLDLGPNGEISLRGSENVAVLVNGKRAGILGDERKSCAVSVPIPAAMIDRVEIITSPSAEYDPDGMTGIVNIILKEDKVSGYNGEFSINAGSTNKLNLGSTLSYRNNKLHLFSKFSTEMLEQRGNGYRVTNAEDREDYRNVKDNELYFINLGSKYDISDRMLFASEAKFTRYYRNTLDSTYGSQTDTIYVDSQEDGFAQVYELGLYTNFLNDSKLVLELSYDGQVKDENRDAVGTASHDSSGYNLDLSKVILRADYYHNLSDNLQYETGYKGRFNTHNKNYDTDNSTHVFQYNENIHALYGTVTFALTEKLQSKAGLRFEQVLASVFLDTTGTLIETPNNYDHVYPSAHLAYIFSPYSNLKFGYSTRVNRPELKMLDPFPHNQYISEVDSVGNPDLKPEFVDAFELSYALTQDKYKTDLSLYHHNIKDVILWDDDIDTVTYNNSGKGSLNGVDIMLKVSPLNIWDLTFTGNYYESKISGGTEDDQNGSTSGGIIRGISMFKIPSGGDLELSGTYRLPKEIITGTVWPDGQYTLDMAYQVSLFDDRLKLTCKVIDILDSDIYEQDITETTDDGDFHINSYRKYDQRTFYLTLLYKFGNI